MVDRKPLGLSRCYDARAHFLQTCDSRLRTD